MATRQKICAASGTPADVVKITTYVADVRDRMNFRAIRDEFFGQREPASTMVGAGSRSHPDYMVEAEAMAVI
jgi:enamine deaminase RidA (YjgF/YER057c/UK114 family)